jgi:hypothetical protein
VYTWLDPQRTRYGFGYGSPWSLAGLAHALGGHLLRCLAWGKRRCGGVVVVTIVQLEWGPSSTPNIRFVLCGAKNQ